MAKKKQKKKAFVDDPWKVGGTGLLIGFVIATFAIQAAAFVMLGIGAVVGAVGAVLYSTYMANKDRTNEGKK